MFNFHYANTDAVSANLALNKVIGDLSNEEKVLFGLDLLSRKGRQKKAS